MVYAFDASVSWKGDKAVGKKMEQEVNSFFEGDDKGGLSKVLTDLAEYDPPLRSFDGVSLFGGKDVPPQTLSVSVAQHWGRPESFFEPLFGKYPGISFYLNYNLRNDDNDIVEYSGWGEFDPSDYDEDEVYEKRDNIWEITLQKVGEWLEFSKEEWLSGYLGGDTLRYVPRKFHSPELFMAAVKQDGGAIRFVPEKAETAELCLAALKNGASLRDVSQKSLTAEMYAAAVPNDGRALEYVPEA
jgi:hypothetical protein